LLSTRRRRHALRITTQPLPSPPHHHTDAGEAAAEVAVEVGAQPRAPPQPPAASATPTKAPSIPKLTFATPGSGAAAGGGTAAATTGKPLLAMTASVQGEDGGGGRSGAAAGGGDEGEEEEFELFDASGKVVVATQSAPVDATLHTPQPRGHAKPPQVPPSAALATSLQSPPPAPASGPLVADPDADAAAFAAMPEVPGAGTGAGDVAGGAPGVGVAAGRVGAETAIAPPPPPGADFGIAYQRIAVPTAPAGRSGEQFAGEAALAAAAAQSDIIRQSLAGRLAAGGGEDDEFDYGDVDAGSSSSSGGAAQPATLPRPVVAVSQTTTASGPAPGSVAALNTLSSKQPLSTTPMLTSPLAHVPPPAPAQHEEQPPVVAATVLGQGAAAALAAVRAGIVAAAAAEQAAVYAEMEKRMLATSEVVGGAAHNAASSTAAATGTDSAQPATTAPSTKAGSGKPGELAVLAEDGEEEEEGEEDEDEGGEGDSSEHAGGGGSGASATAAAPAAATVPAPAPAPAPTPALPPTAAPVDDEEAALMAEFDAATQARMAAAAAAAVASGGAGTGTAGMGVRGRGIGSTARFATTAPTLMAAAQTHRSAIIATAPDPDAGCWARLFAEGMRAELHPERDAIFCLAKLRYDGADATHAAVFPALFTGITGSEFNGTTSAWTLIGFQREGDFSTDLRDGGMLGPLQMLWLATAHRPFVQKLQAVASSDTHGFPLMIQAINFTATTLAALRYGRLNKMANREAAAGSAGASATKPGPVFAAANAYYAALLFAFYAEWVGTGATIARIGTIVRAITATVNRDIPAAIERFRGAMAKPPFTTTSTSSGAGSGSAGAGAAGASDQAITVIDGSGGGAGAAGGAASANPLMSRQGRYAVG